MEDEERVKTEPAKRGSVRIKWLRWRSVLAAVPTLALAYCIARPPELVWWRSSAIGPNHRQVKMLVPAGWQIQQEAAGDTPPGGDWEREYFFHPIDNMPKYLRWLRPAEPDATV